MYLAFGLVKINENQVNMCLFGLCCQISLKLTIILIITITYF